MSKHPRLTDEQRAERRAADRERTLEAVERLRSSDGWQAWLATRARFRLYSLRNQCLIAAQAPDAVKVAGFRQWLSLGYCVRRGETAIWIWAPCPPSRKKLQAWRQAGGKPEDEPRTFFKLSPVFGDHQVQELPPPAVPALIRPPIRDIQGCELADRTPALERLAAEIGSPVGYQPLAGELHGFYIPLDRRIVIDPGYSPNSQVKTLAHELAHALIRADRKDNDPALDRAQEELVVESVAYSAVASVGLVSDEYTVPYLASWAENTDIAVIESAAELVDRLATRIENALHNGGDGGQEPLATPAACEMPVAA